MSQINKLNLTGTKKREKKLMDFTSAVQTLYHVHRPRACIRMIHSLHSKNTSYTFSPTGLKRRKLVNVNSECKHLNSQHILCTSEVKNWTTISISTEHQQQRPTDFSRQQQLPCTHKPYCGDRTGNSSFKSSAIKISPFPLCFSTLRQKHDGKTRERKKCPCI